MALCNMLYVISLSVWINVSLSMTWSLSNQEIPVLKQINNAFIGYHNETVLMLGIGTNNVGDGFFPVPNDIIELSLDGEWSTSTTTNIIFGLQTSQSSIQINEQLWMLADFHFMLTPNFDPQFLRVFDLNKKSIIQNISFPGTATSARCVTSYNEYIFIIGGQTTGPGSFVVSEFHIYNRMTENWSTGTSLNDITKRYYHSCNVVRDTVYVIGGQNQRFDDGIIVVYLKMDPNNCCNGIWEQINDTFPQPSIFHRSVVFESFIYVIGGRTPGGSKHKQVNVIDTISKTISFPPTNQLVYAKTSVSAIVVHNTIYVFGGDGVSGTEDTHYQYASIPTQNPTFSPTSTPSIPPSNAPSQNPTACVDYNNSQLHYISNDGKDYKHPINISYEINYPFQSILSNHSVIYYNTKP
eukprot:473503_1